ncbi:MAG: endonuclease III [Candidatus Dadabacteria bacterium]|nr:endonuclease III [Candidatus Dadabacteria bacterium]
MKDSDIHKIIKILREESRKWDVPIVTLTAETSRDPFKVLISTILSLRTQDTTTAKVSSRLFGLAQNPYDMIKLDVKVVEKAIYPVGFYKTKARTILNLCRELIKRYNSRVPDDLDELLKLKGVGRKTANLVVTLGYGKPGICVDTHVHRISNRLGYVRTKTPHETEMMLRKKLPKRYWIEYNDLLVSFGQQLCRPMSPWCSVCPIEGYCDRVGVERHR